jgi:hypothetical protein
MLTDWHAISIFNVGVGTRPGLVQVNCAGCTLDSIDFSLHGGAQVEITNSASGTVTISNSKFLATGSATQSQPIVCDVGCPSLTVTKNTIDQGTAVPPNQSIITYQGSGTFTFSYNWLKNPYSDMVSVGCAGGRQIVVAKFNLFQGGRGGGHPDWYQTGSNCTYTNTTITYNTYAQDPHGTQGVMLTQNSLTYPVFLAATLSNNTMITQPGATLNYFFQVDTSELNGSVSVQNNYIDRTGNNAGFLRGSSGLGPYSGTVTCSGNKNMVTGATVRQARPPCT